MDDFRKYIVEFIGTFFLVFTIALCLVLPGNGVIAAIAIGFILMVMVYAGGYISGGHYNPAVSLAATVRGVLSVKHCIFYMITQFLAALAASGLIMAIGGRVEGMPACPFTIMQLIIGEFLFTFALCYVVLTTATSPDTEGNSYYGLAIGSTVTVGAFVAGGVLCFGAFNPAVALGLWAVNIACLKLALITIGINLVAAICAALVYKLVDRNRDY